MLHSKYDINLNYANYYINSGKYRPHVEIRQGQQLL